MNGPAIYKTHGRAKFKEGKISFTENKDGSLNAIYRADEAESRPPAEIEIKSIHATKDTRITMQGVGEVKWTRANGGLVVKIPETAQKNPPCKFAWSFRITNPG